MTELRKKREKKVTSQDGEKQPFIYENKIKVFSTDMHDLGAWWTWPGPSQGDMAQCKAGPWASSISPKASRLCAKAEAHPGLHVVASAVTMPERTPYSVLLGSPQGQAHDPGMQSSKEAVHWPHTSSWSSSALEGIAEVAGYIAHSHGYKPQDQLILG